MVTLTATRSAPQPLFVFMRRAVVIVCCAYTIATILPSVIVAFGQRSDVGFLGLHTDYDGNITSIDQNSPASAAGITSANRVDFTKTPRDSLLFVAPSQAFVRRETPVPVVLKASDGTSRRVLLTAAPYSMNKAALAVRIASTLLFLVTSATIYWVKPSRAALGFLIYCVGLSPAVFDQRFTIYQSPLTWTINVVIVDVLIAAAIVGIVLFALELYDSSSDELGVSPRAAAGWLSLRNHIERLLPAVFLTFAVMESWPDVATLYLGTNAQRLQWAMFLCEAVALLFGGFALYRAFALNPINKRRLSWIMFGYTFGVTANFVAGISLYSSVPQPPQALSTLLVTLNVLLPVGVYYGIMRHRLFGLTFVVSRAVLALIATAVIAWLFSLLEQRLEAPISAREKATTSPYVAYVFSAVTVSLTLLSGRVRDAINERLDDVIYRTRTKALAVLTILENQMTEHEGVADIHTALIRGAAVALALRDAAIYVAQASGFELTASRGAAFSNNVDGRDPLVQRLRATEATARPAETGCSEARLRTMTIAIPIFVRGALFAFVVYGPHKNGEDLDEVEILALERLVKVAAAAYASAELTVLRTSIALLSERVAKLEEASESVRPPQKAPQQ